MDPRVAGLWALATASISRPIFNDCTLWTPANHDNILNQVQEALRRWARNVLGLNYQGRPQRVKCLRCSRTQASQLGRPSACKRRTRSANPSWYWKSSTNVATYDSGRRSPRTEPEQAEVLTHAACDRSAPSTPMRRNRGTPGIHATHRQTLDARPIAVVCHRIVYKTTSRTLTSAGQVEQTWKSSSVHWYTNGGSGCQILISYQRNCSKMRTNATSLSWDFLSVATSLTWA